MDELSITGREIEPSALPIGPEQLRKFTETLHEYHSAKSRTDSRIKSAEQWWKLRNTCEEQKESFVGKDGGFSSVSGWLHNVITSKHADAMEAYPMPNILPREQGDRPEATILSAIVPVILRQNDFEAVYSDAMWDKAKYGTGVYKITWNASKLNGLGDIDIQECNLLNLFWEPGIKDIQKSRFFFHTEMMDKDLLEEQYPQTVDKLKSTQFVSSSFLYDDTVDTSNKFTVIDVYYHKQGGELHYCKYVGDIVLYSTENEGKGPLYQHGMYPYVFDPLFPIEGSPCGYGYVDLCRNPQTAIDLMNTAFVKNTMVNATPRFFSRVDGNINEAEFADLTKPIVHVNGTLDEMSLRQIETTPIQSANFALLDRMIDELRQTSGNTETATGSTTHGVTAASAIAALQEASGKGSRDATKGSYRAFEKVVYLVIELIRQFYEDDRYFRIVGQAGQEVFISYTNERIRAQDQGSAFGMDMGFRLPVFDIEVQAERKNVYSRVSQNELALQFYQLGFFSPPNADPALATLQMMDFDNKDEIMTMVQRNGTIFDKLVQYMQLALALAQESHPEMVEGLSQDIMQTTGGQPATAAASSTPEVDQQEGLKPPEATHVTNARKRSNAASQPDGGGQK